MKMGEDAFAALVVAAAGLQARYEAVKAAERAYEAVERLDSGSPDLSGLRSERIKALQDARWAFSKAKGIKNAVQGKVRWAAESFARGKEENARKGIEEALRLAYLI